MEIKEHLKDRKGACCIYCGKGLYEEGSIYDDWEGKVTCSLCKTRVDRYVNPEIDVQ